MRIVCFYHSLSSDWNHGNAHFLRGIVSELMARGHEVVVYEPANGWSLSNLLHERGPEALQDFAAHYPGLSSVQYQLESLDLDAALAGAELVLVHEWNEPALIARIGAHRRRRGKYLLLFHDTHHRMLSARSELARCDLTPFDGVLAFGEVLRELYERAGFAGRAFTWHEAADVRVFKPLPAEQQGELVWIGNWGDGERSEELREFLLAPVAELGLRAHVYGVRYPAHALQALQDAGLRYCGFLPNYLVPAVFASHLLTVHVPRRPYVQSLPGIPTIRVFEALACGIPLLSAPWRDSEQLFRAGEDFLYVRDGRELADYVRLLLQRPDLRAQLSARGRETILARHTCAHRVDELLAICRRLGLSAGRTADSSASEPTQEEAACLGR
jgi:spore maturation protein CgeB